MDARSGRHWVAWANTHARNSRRIEDLDSMFRRKIEAFTYALLKMVRALRSTTCTTSTPISRYTRSGRHMAC